MDNKETKEQPIPVTQLQPMNDLDIDKDGDIDFQDVKKIYQSKTFWVNLIAIVAIMAQSKFGFIIDETIQVQLLGIINIGLRMITNQPVKWK